ncbi:RDD family protein [Fundicoccus sp. Sow4_D5]|uniref:RDD family protein n=1 Tax=unclassified Fundicoccus TaxID=2761543 RepID=UPI003F9380CE
MSHKDTLEAVSDQVEDSQTLLAQNPISKKQRLTELLVDWLMICLYLISLFLVMLIVNYFVYGEALPAQDERYSHLIATFTTSVPISLIFAWLDYRWAGTLGKRFAGLTVRFKKLSFGRSLLRNIIKFLPWQFGHMAVIHFMFGEIDAFGIVSYGLSVGLLVLFLYMGLYRLDKRHLADLIAGSQVVQATNSSEKSEG